MSKPAPYSHRQSIEVGQVWRSRDKRENGRLVRVVDLDDDFNAVANSYLWIKNCDQQGRVSEGGRTPRMRAVTLLSRFDRTSIGGQQ